MIARLLNISNRTVEGYIENIKIKMGCNSKVELIDKAIDKGFVKFIPSSFLQEHIPSGLIVEKL